MFANPQLINQFVSFESAGTVLHAYTKVCLDCCDYCFDWHSRNLIELEAIYLAALGGYDSVVVHQA